MNRNTTVTTLTAFRTRQAARAIAQPSEHARENLADHTLVIVCMVFLIFALIGFWTGPEMTMH